jgi:hypothetical protein
MPSLGQTLCQLEKSISNHGVGRVAKFFAGKMPRKMAKDPVFVAIQRQYFCSFQKLLMNQGLGLSPESDLVYLSRFWNLSASFAQGHGKTAGNRRTPANHRAVFACRRPFF